MPKLTGNQSLLRELAYTARNFSASEAEKLGLVSRIVPGGRDQVVQAALELAKTIAAKSPIAVSGTKRLISHARIILLKRIWFIRRAGMRMLS